MYSNNRLELYETFEEDSYEVLRESLAPKYQNLPPEDIEQILQNTCLGNIAPKDAEDFFRELGQFASRVTPVIAKVGSAALPVVGTAVGTAVGGPVGGTVGGAIGSAASGAIGSAKVPKPSRNVTPSQMLKPQVPKRQQLQQPRKRTLGTSPATVQLIVAIFQPQVLQALLAIMMGSAGKQNITVGSKQVPVAAFANLLGTLANQVAAEYNAVSFSDSEEIPRYLMDSEGEFLVDPVVPEQRAAVLLNLLQQSNQEQLVEKISQRKSNHIYRQQTLLAEVDEMYDALELVNLYADYET